MDEEQLKFFDHVSKLIAHFGGANPTEAATAVEKALAFVGASSKPWQSWTGVAQLLSRDHLRLAGEGGAEELREARRQLALAQAEVRRLKREKVEQSRLAGGAGAEELREAQQQLAIAQDQVRRLRREKAEQSRLSEQVLRPLEQENARLKAALANAKEANALRPLEQEMELITVKGERDRLRDELDRLRGAELTAAKARPQRGDVPELLRRAHADPALATLSVRELARRLGVSPQTVFTYRHKHDGVADVR
jgi:hypothetical protein